MNKRLLVVLLALFVGLDLVYTFYQGCQLPLEGDLPSIVLPGPECRQVLGDPFGWAVLARNEVYVAPNRFFAHAAMVSYFKTVPFALQRLTTPINSIYAAGALFAVAVQALLLYLLGVYISGSYRLGRRFWVAVALLVPLFQLSGYNDQMGIIDHSITYTFFYAFPLALLLLLLLPFYRAAYTGQPLRLGWPACVALVGLMVVLAFNGAIITGVVAVLFLGIGMHWVVQQWRGGAGLAPEAWLARLRALPRLPVALLGVFVLLCLYSLYIGRNELESVGNELPVWRRYARLPSGIFRMLQRVGLPLLALAALANAYLIRWRLPATPESRRILGVLGWLALFAVAYTLLLPLGGYREYRPLIIRRDSAMPILLGLMFFYGLSTYFLLHHLPAGPRRWYLGAVLLFSAVYLGADTPSVAAQRWSGGKLWIIRDNTCERAGLERLARATEPVVRVSAACPVMAWGLISNPAYSETNAQLLEYWGITNGKKLYYNEGW